MKNTNAKQILLMGLISLVLIAGYYRWNSQKTNDSLPVNASSAPSNEAIVAPCDESEAFFKENEYCFFANSKLEKSKARSESIETLNKIIENPVTTQEAKVTSQKQISEIAKNIEKESIIEGLVKAKGYPDCTAFIDENGANIVVKAVKLDSSKVAQIKDIITSQTGFKPTQIKISVCS